MFRDGIASVLVFRLGEERFGIPLADVDEVIEAQAIQRVPDAPPTVLGVTTVRGALVTVYDPHSLLSVGGSGEGALLLFDRGDRRVALAIDDVFDAIVVEPRDVIAAPGHGSDSLIAGLVRRGSELVTLLDTAALLTEAIDVREGGRT